MGYVLIVFGEVSILINLGVKIVSENFFNIFFFSIIIVGFGVVGSFYRLEGLVIFNI